MRDPVPPTAPGGRLPHVTGAVAAAALTALAATLAGRPLVSAGEERVFRLLNDVPAAWWPLLWPPMQLGNLAAPAVIGAVVAAGTRRWRPVAAVLVAGYGAWAGAQLLKDLVRRDRPEVLLADVVVREPVEGLGFVSGHAAISAAITTALWPYLGPRGRVAAAVLAGLVGFGRVYSGAHLPLDVVGGQAIGVLAGLGATAIIDRVRGRPILPSGR
jgi:membrane-associated phospholipid phosphatase